MNLYYLNGAAYENALSDYRTMIYDKIQAIYKIYEDKIYGTNNDEKYDLIATFTATLLLEFEVAIELMTE